MLTANLEKKVRRVFFIVVAISPAIYGYITIVSVVLAAVGGLIDWVRRRSIVNIAKHDWILILPGFLYFIILTLSLIRSDFEVADLSYLDRPAIFLVLIFLIVHFRVYQCDYFFIFIKYIPVGAVLLIPYFYYDVWYLQIRLEAGARNAIPLGIISLIFSQISLLNLLSDSKRQQIWGVFGFLIYSLAILYSQTRSVQIVFVPCFLFTVWTLRKHISSKVKFTFAASIIIIAVLFSMSDNGQKRFQLLTSSIYNIVAGEMISDVSVSLRLQLLKKGWCISQSELAFGYGLSNRRDLLNGPMQNAPEKLKTCYGAPHTYFNHFHNGYLTALIDAGILGAITILFLIGSPIVFLIASSRNEYQTHRSVMAVSLVAAYGTESLVGQPFGGDLLDAFYVIICLLLALSVSPPFLNENNS